MIRRATVDDAAAMARVHIDTTRATYAGILPAAHLAALDYGSRAARWAHIIATNAPVFVAVDDGRVIGFADGGPSRTPALSFDGELYALYVDPAQQRRGWGRQLVAHVALALAGAGHRAMFVWVLRDNPACGFYAALGGAVVVEQDLVIGGATVREVAYGWSTLDGLCA